jgi:hypothetical protein
MGGNLLEVLKLDQSSGSAISISTFSIYDEMMAAALTNNSQLIVFKVSVVDVFSENQTHLGEKKGGKQEKP